MGGPGVRDLTLAVKRRKTHIFSSYAKIWGEIKISASGVSPKWVKGKRLREKKRDREKESERERKRETESW